MTRNIVDITTPPLITEVSGDEASVDSDRTIGHPPPVTASPSKTMPLRHGKLDATTPNSMSKLHKGSRADSPISLHSSQGDRSPRSVSPTIASPAVEAVESMDEADAIADQIRLLGPNITYSHASSEELQALKAMSEHIYEGLTGDEKNVLNIIEELKRRFATNPAPFLELRAATVALAQINESMESDMELWAESLSQDRVLPDNLQIAIHALLKRNTSYSNEFLDNHLQIDGPAEINSLCAQFIRCMNHLVQHDIARLRASPDEDVRLYSRRFVSTTLKLCQQNELHGIMGETFWSSLAGIFNHLAGSDGFFSLLDPFLEELHGKLPKQPKLFPVITDIVNLCACAFNFVKHVERDELGRQLAQDLPNKLSPAFIKLENRLLQLLKSHIQILDVNAFIAQLDMLKQLGKVLYMRPTNILTTRLRDRTQMYNVDPVPQQLRSLLIEQTIQFPVYLQMLSASRMDFRLRGLTRMTDTLLQIWRNHGSQVSPYTGSCVLRYGLINCILQKYLLTFYRYVTGFLLDKKVVQYLVGPESHFELIRRCYNVPSFLFVSNTMTPEIMDALWQPVLSNKDPRVVNATLLMSQEMATNMHAEQLVSLCERISMIPYESTDFQVTELIARVVDKLRKTCGQGDMVRPQPRSKNIADSLCSPIQRLTTCLSG